MSGDSDHKPLKPAHPAVKSIAGVAAYTLPFSNRHNLHTAVTAWNATAQVLSAVQLRHAVYSL